MRRATDEISVQDATIEIDGHGFHGDLTVPAGATGVVVFAHGSGSSRLSPRNRFVAEVLVEAGLATLLVDLADRLDLVVVALDEDTERRHVRRVVRILQPGGLGEAIDQ